MGRDHGRPTSTQMVMIKRREKVLRFLLDGVTNRAQIAAALNVSVPTASNDIEAVITRMREDSPETQKRVDLATAQLDDWIRKHVLEFAKSQESTEEVATTIKPEKCTDCDGKGCKKCGGKGEVETETVTRKVRGKTGDPAYLREARLCLEERNKLQGIYPAKVKLKAKKKGEEGSVSATIDLSMATPDEIQRMREEMERLRLGVAGRPAIDVDSEEEEEEVGETGSDS